MINENASFCEKLHQLQNLFDLGVEIMASSDGVVIKGYDFFDEEDERDNFSVERTYEFDFEKDEDGKIIDNYDEILSIIMDDSYNRNNRG